MQTPTVSNWQCSKLSPTLSDDIIRFSCLLFCSSNVCEAEVLTCCPVPWSQMPMAPHSFRVKMMSSSRSELSELSVCAIDKHRFRNVGIQSTGQWVMSKTAKMTKTKQLWQNLKRHYILCFPLSNSFFLLLPSLNVWNKPRQQFLNSTVTRQA